MNGAEKIPIRPSGNSLGDTPKEDSEPPNTMLMMVMIHKMRTRTEGTIKLE